MKPRLLVACIFLGSALARAQSAPQPAVPAIISLLDHYPVVFIGEDHWLKSAGEFYVSLVQNPEFSKHANTLVLECGNSLYQPILDRYENGEDVPFEQISQVWRNTTKVMGWESPIYANLIAAVREVNRRLAVDERIRVIAADSPIDWGKVRDYHDYEKAFGGNEFFASVIEREVLAKNRKALVIMGMNHVIRGGDSRGNTDVTDMVERRHRHSTFVIAMIGPSPSADPQLRGTSPLFYALRGTRMGQQNYLNRRYEDAADAFLYLAHMDSRAMPDWSAIQADKTYFTELQRRHLIEFGCPLNLQTWRAMDRPCSR